MRPLIERYREHLDELSAATTVVSIGEGGTPLLPAPRLARAIGAPHLDLYLKFEGANPTGSFKDRGMTAAVSAAVSRGARALVCASTGNTSASAAAFAARAGIPCVVLIPDGAVALGKLAQALVYGAHVLAVEGNFDQALDVVRRLPERFPLTIVNSTNPDRLIGQMTAAYEIVDALGVPAYHALPVGNAGNITAYFRGYRRYHQRGKAPAIPKMLGFQAAGAAPLVSGQPVKDPKTIATAIKIGNPASWDGAMEAIRESGGAIESVTDEQILEAYRLLASTEGVFAEPASAASVAGVKQKAATGYFPEGARVVCTLTGHGLKDPEIAIKGRAGATKVGAAFDEVSRVLEPLLR
jgi:threonine synthase